jgi:hypothetical protein
MSEQIMDMLMQMGVAGMMGVLWIWERTLSRKREQQLTDVHDRLMSQREELKVLVRLIQRNTTAIDRFAETQKRLCRLLEEMAHDEEEPAQAA